MSKEKNPGGAPPLIDDPEEMARKIEEYFLSLLPKPITQEGTVLTTDKGQIAYTREKKPSVVGLALFLGYESRQSFYDNVKKEKFSYILKRARSRVELEVLDGGMDEKIPQSLTIFLLKQFGYSDKPEQQKADFEGDKSMLDKLVNGED